MNTDHLNLILRNYIDRFDQLDQGETYKWVAVRHFQDNWNIDADDFGAMFKNAVQATYNMISNSRVQPTSGIVALAKQENETVREMFRSLYADDGSDLTARQNRIDDFVAQAEAMLLKYAPGKWKYRQDVRTVITYLSLRHPDDNFIYKATPAHTFTKYIDYANDLGSGSNFKLINYYRLCEQLVQAIDENPELLAVNERRFNATTWPDTKHHILASDIIYCASCYTLFGDLELPKLDKKSVAAKTRQNRNTELETRIIQIQTDLNDILEEKETMIPQILKGVTVQHKKFGNGVIVEQDHNVITVRFSQGDKKLGLPAAFSNETMTAERPDIKEYYEHLTELLSEEQRLNRDLSLAKMELDLEG